MDKLLSARDAVAVIQSGMTVGIGGWGPRRKPMALVRELLRSDVSDLTVIAYGGADVGLLCAAGKVRKVIFAFVSLDFMPLEPGFRLARQAGNVEVNEIDEGMMLLGLRAGAWGLPFIPTRVGLGTDVERNNPDIVRVDSPYDDKEWLAMPALKPDVSLIHVTRADRRGVCEIASPDHYMDDMFARAATHTIVSADEIVDSAHFNDPQVARASHWERAVTDAVVHTPGGAHPSSSDPLYGFDVTHYKAYGQLLSEQGYSAYAEQFLGSDEAAYQTAVGGLDVIQQLPLPVY